MTRADTTPDTTDREIIVTRLIAAPRALVWQMFTDPAHVIHWWGPDGFRNTNLEHNLRVGGAWRFIMHGPDGTDYPNRAIYTEITPPERLAYAHDADAGGDPAHAFNAEVTLTDEAGQTRVTLRLILQTVEQRQAVTDFAVEGAEQTLARLDAYVSARTGSV